MTAYWLPDRHAVKGQKRLLVYLIGQPAAGKTSLMAELTRERVRHPSDVGCPHITLVQRHDRTDSLPAVIAELGVDREGFGGTDALSLSIQPKALQFLKDCPFQLVLGEGDRLANKAFFDGAAAIGWEVRVVYLDTPDELAVNRRARRGNTQNAAWVRGRITKVRKLAAAGYVTRLNGAKPIAALAAELRQYIGAWLGGAELSAFIPQEAEV